MRKITHGFTLVELLVVITIIVILAAILFPVFANARHKAYQAGCTSNLKQINTAMQLYRADFDGRMPYMFIHAADGMYYRWMHVTFLYSGSSEMYSCPANPVEPGDYKAMPAQKTPLEPPDTSYLYNQPYMEALRDTSVKDPAGTIVLMDGWWFDSEAEDNARQLNAPMFNIENADANRMASWINNEVPSAPIYVSTKTLERMHRHNERVNVAFFDGHVKTVSHAVPGDFTPQRD